MELLESYDSTKLHKEQTPDRHAAEVRGFLKKAGPESEPSQTRKRPIQSSDSGPPMFGKVKHPFFSRLAFSPRHLVAWQPRRGPNSSPRNHRALRIKAPIRNSRNEVIYWANLAILQTLTGGGLSIRNSWCNALLLSVRN